jgi:hypothetical protein
MGGERVEGSEGGEIRDLAALRYPVCTRVGSYLFFFFYQMGGKGTELSEGGEITVVGPSCMHAMILSSD